jgi:hypothetical protein
MHRLTSGEKKETLHLDDEPDFYKIGELFPLPLGTPIRSVSSQPHRGQTGIAPTSLPFGSPSRSTDGTNTGAYLPTLPQSAPSAVATTGEQPQEDISASLEALQALVKKQQEQLLAIQQQRRQKSMEMEALSAQLSRQQQWTGSSHQEQHLPIAFVGFPGLNSGTTADGSADSGVGNSSGGDIDSMELHDHFQVFQQAFQQQQQQQQNQYHQLQQYQPQFQYFAGGTPAPASNFGHEETHHNFESPSRQTHFASFQEQQRLQEHQFVFGDDFNDDASQVNPAVRLAQMQQAQQQMMEAVDRSHHGGGRSYANDQNAASLVLLEQQEQQMQQLRQSMQQSGRSDQLLLDSPIPQSPPDF